MPHIHTELNQHDMTISGYIVRVDQVEPLCLVHMHRKMGKLMQIGGHIELTETPWQTVAHEVEEESGFSLVELRVVQHTADRVVEKGCVNHPTPFNVNTHSVGNEHFHSDLSYGFVANGPARNTAAEGESADLRWMTMAELDVAVVAGDVLPDAVEIYRYLVDHLDSYTLVDADSYSLAKPTEAIATYKFGAPGE
ncbi:MAG: NUDIX domain-containing protein [Candidatus Saccharimonas sp.]